jgi:hypothetical protein
MSIPLFLFLSLELFVDFCSVLFSVGKYIFLKKKKKKKNSRGRIGFSCGVF